jgi:putative transposase
MLPLRVACEALGVPLATAKRHLAPPKPKAPRKPRPSSPRRLTDEERRVIVEVMHSERFLDQTPRQAFTELLEEGRYLGSVRTYYRVLADKGETRERRNQRAPKCHPIPRLVATRPNEVWTWDITKLPTYESGVFLNLYLVLDLFSRYPVAWMVAERENSALSKQLLAAAIHRHAIEPGALTVHNDRGAPMTATGFVDLLAELGAKPSKSRPRVSNDNAFSEACFKTVKYQPDYPGRFENVRVARRWLAEFFEWYAHQHRHSGLALFTPADVFFGRVGEVAARRQAALDAAFEAHPDRFVRGRPTVRLPAPEVAINPLSPEAPVVVTPSALAPSGARSPRRRHPSPIARVSASPTRAEAGTGAHGAAHSHAEERSSEHGADGEYEPLAGREHDGIVPPAMGSMSVAEVTEHET